MAIHPTNHPTHQTTHPTTLNPAIPIIVADSEATTMGPIDGHPGLPLRRLVDAVVGHSLHNSRIYLGRLLQEHVVAVPPPKHRVIPAFLLHNRRRRAIQRQRILRLPRWTPTITRSGHRKIFEWKMKERRRRRRCHRLQKLQLHHRNRGSVFH